MTIFTINTDAGPATLTDPPSIDISAALDGDADLPQLNVTATGGTLNVYPSRMNHNDAVSVHLFGKGGTVDPVPPPNITAMLIPVAGKWSANVVIDGNQTSTPLRDIWEQAFTDAYGVLEDKMSRVNHG